MTESILDAFWGEQALDRLPVAICVCDRAGTITRVNEAAASLWGRRPAPDERYCGAQRLFALDGSPMAHDASPMAQVLASGLPVRNREIVMERADGSRVVVLMQIDPIKGPAGTLVGAINCFHDVDALRRVRMAELADQAAQRLAAIVESSEDAILAKDLNGIIQSWNQGAERLFGYTAEETIGRSVTMLLPADRHNEEPAILADIRQGRRVDHYETVRQHKDGGLLDISLTVSPIRNPEGVIVGASKIARDIGERRRAQEQQHLLIREMDHRVKNLFALSSSVVTLSARSAATPAELAAAVRERLGALARAHALTVSQGRDDTHQMTQSTMLHGLIRTIVLPYDGQTDAGQPRIAIAGPDISLADGAMTSFALLLHEFATNAAKYGALSTGAGHVEIECSQDETWFVLTWTERGGPAVTPQIDGEGFGSLLSRATVGRQLGGSIVRDWQAEGLVIRLTVARDRLAG